MDILNLTISRSFDCIAYFTAQNTLDPGSKSRDLYIKYSAYIDASTLNPFSGSTYLSQKVCRQGRTLGFS